MSRKGVERSGAEGLEESGVSSAVKRLIRQVLGETQQRLRGELAPVQQNFAALHGVLMGVRNAIAALIRVRLGDHALLHVEDPRDFFRQAEGVRTDKIKELISDRVRELLAKYDEVAAFVQPLRAAIVEVERMMGIEPVEEGALGAGERKGDGRDGANGTGKTGRVDGRAARYEGVRSGIRDAIFAKLRTSDMFVNSGDFCKETDCSPITSLGVIKDLIIDGVLLKQGSGRATRYFITSKGQAEIRGGGRAAGPAATRA